MSFHFSVFRFAVPMQQVPTSAIYLAKINIKNETAEQTAVFLAAVPLF
jgi:hypothetical protein